jgi:replication-associated recombination protein RarA
VIPHWSTDPFATLTTVSGLPSDEVRSALHKHVRGGRLEQSVRAALELARTDEHHEHMLWLRLRVIAAEDVGLAQPMAPVVIGALHDSVGRFPVGSHERLEMAAQAAAYLATATKDPTAAEILMVVLADGEPPAIPDEAVDVHTRRGQELGRTVGDWWRTGATVTPEAPDRDRTWKHRLDALHDPPT